MASRLISLQRLRSAPVSLLLRSIAPCIPYSPSDSNACSGVQRQRLDCWGLKFKEANRYVVCSNFHTSVQLCSIQSDVVEPQNSTENPISVVDDAKSKMKRKKLKGKRAVVRWLKFFRWRKKKEYERMTAEEKILYKLKKARRKEDRLVAALKKIEPSETSETTHDPEILTPEEHFYFLKMGNKCKNYVPVGRRGIFQGVILNMHLHWKKHQTLKVVVKTFTPEEVREIAAELARLSGGIVLDIVENNTIIMYRGKNYLQPPTEIMSPKVTLSRKKALDKSKYLDALRAVRKFIPKLEQDLENLHEQMQGRRENEVKAATGEETTAAIFDELIVESLSDKIDGSKETETNTIELDDEDSLTDFGSFSESEDLSDIFSTDSDMDFEEKADVPPLYLDQFDKFPSRNKSENEDLEQHLRQFAAEAKKDGSSRKDVNLKELDEIDRIFLRAGSLLKKKRR